MRCLHWLIWLLFLYIVHLLWMPIWRIKLYTLIWLKRSVLIRHKRWKPALPRAWTLQSYTEIKLRKVVWASIVNCFESVRTKLRVVYDGYYLYCIHNDTLCTKSRNDFAVSGVWFDFERQVLNAKIFSRLSQKHPLTKAVWTSGLSTGGYESHTPRIWAYPQISCHFSYTGL